jgi:hypothetical protein
MPRAVFKTPDIPAEFFELDHPTQCLIVRIGHDAYKSLQAGVREQVVGEMSEDDAAKAAALRAEGIKSAMESVRSRLAAMDALEAELHLARAANDEMRMSISAEAAKRAEALVADARKVYESEKAGAIQTAKKDFEIEKLHAIAELKEQLATAAATAGMLALLKVSNVSFR